MAVLVTGGAGKMGRHLARELFRAGYSVHILCLPGEGAENDPELTGLNIFFGDITIQETLHAALVGVDTVFHLAAILIAPGRADIFETVNATGTRNMVLAAESAIPKVKHFIYVSSISVQYPLSNAYSRSKLKGEAWVRSSQILNYTIVRPSLAYGNKGGEEFIRFATYIAQAPLVFLPQGGKALKSPVHLDDLVQAFLALPGNTKSYGKTYSLTGSENLTLKEMAQYIHAHLGIQKRIFPVPGWCCLLLVFLLEQWQKISGLKSPFTWQTYTGLVQNAIANDTHAQHDLGFRPRGFRQGLASLAPNSLSFVQPDPGLFSK